MMRTITMNKIVLILTIFWISLANASFYDGAKRGWFWFEERLEEEEQQKKSNNLLPREKFEQSKKELEDLRYAMFVNPIVENVRAYRLKEEEMWANAYKLHDAWLQVGFLDPKLRSNPTNVYSVKLDREVKKEKEVTQIFEFLKDYDLIFFRNGSCKYCQRFEPILKDFANKYQVQVEAISADKSESQYFPNKDGELLIRAFNITEYPSVIAVNKQNARKILELTKGLLTLDELEEHCLLAMQYIRSRQQ